MKFATLEWPLSLKAGVRNALPNGTYWPPSGVCVKLRPSQARPTAVVPCPGAEPGLPDNTAVSATPPRLGSKMTMSFTLEQPRPHRAARQSLEIFRAEIRGANHASKSD